MKVNVTSTWTIERASREDCERFNQPIGALEIIDPEGDRYDWAYTLGEAKDRITAFYDSVSIYATTTKCEGGIRMLSLDEITLPDDPDFWMNDRKPFQCGHCQTQFDRSTYFTHWKESEACQRADIEHSIRTTFPYCDLRHYKSPAAAAKALHKKLVELGYDEAFIYSPKQQRERGEHPLWTVGVEGGPYEWAVKWTGTGAANGKFGYCECDYSFSVYFVD